MFLLVATVALINLGLGYVLAVYVDASLSRPLGTLTDGRRTAPSAPAAGENARPSTGQAG